MSMNILMMTINDPAGTAIAFTKAINRYSGHRCRLITKEIRYNFLFDKDLHLPWLAPEDWEEVEYLLKVSEVFHFHMTADEDLELGPFRVRDYIEGKMMVHHHHGHPDYRAEPEKYRRKYKERRRDKILVSTPDLLKLFPGAVWMPNVVPLGDPLYLPMRPKSQETIRIAHSPTRRELKNTTYFLETVEKIRRDNGRLAVDLIEQTEHRECLRRKRRCHILFDHLQGYYGVSSLEGLSQGLCVIAGLDQWNRERIREFAGVERLPWVITDERSFPETLRELLEDHDRRREISSYGRRFMEAHWHETTVTRRLMEFYES